MAMVNVVPAADRIPSPINCEIYQLNQSIQWLFETLNTFNGASHGLNDPVNSLDEIFQYFDRYRSHVFAELTKWQHQQLRNRNEITDQEYRLNEIQNCIEKLLRFTFHLLQTIDGLQFGSQPVSYERLEQLRGKIQIKQNNILSDAFIVVKQPIQVVKTTQKLSTSVRWLIGIQLGSKCYVKCEVVSEDYDKIIKDWLREPEPEQKPEPKTIEKVDNDVVEMKYQEHNHGYSADFNGLQIKKIVRSNNADRVAEEKFALLFKMTVENNSKLKIWTISLPVVITVHGIQERLAKATMMWDSAFAEVNRNRFEVRKTVTWQELSDTLNLKCFAETQRKFTFENSCFLYAKLFPNCNIVQDAYISWEQFCKVGLNGNIFTFWDWFYAAIKLIKNKLLELWKKNFIEGFISKAATTAKLQTQEPGTFLLRFSDSIPGAITIAFVNENYMVEHIQPWENEDLSKRCLLNRIKDLQKLKTLFPYNIDKCNLPGYPNDKLQASDGYIPSAMTIRIVENKEAVENETARVNSNLLSENMLQGSNVNENVPMKPLPELSFYCSLDDDINITYSSPNPPCFEDDSQFPMLNSNGNGQSLSGTLQIRAFEGPEQEAIADNCFLENMVEPNVSGVMSIPMPMEHENSNSIINEMDSLLAII